MKRKSRISKSETKDDDKFNFDIPEYKIDPSQRLVIKHTNVPPEKQEDDTLSKRREISSMTLTIQHKNITSSTNASQLHIIDPLSDDVYEAYHKKMVRQETRMITSDTHHSELEAEQLQNVLDGLDVASWRTFLPKITVVKNVDDEEELERKKTLTQETIHAMLQKYKDMKKTISIHSRKQRNLMIDPFSKIERMYSKVDRSSVVGYNSSSDTDEESMDIADIRSRRKQIRQKTFGSSIVVPLSLHTGPHSRFAIVAEPLRHPIVIRLTKQERLSLFNMVEDPNKLALPSCPKIP